jgi:hypothetical protein
MIADATPFVVLLCGFCFALGTAVNERKTTAKVRELEAHRRCLRVAAQATRSLCECVRNRELAELNTHFARAEELAAFALEESKP